MRHRPTKVRISSTEDEPLQPTDQGAWVNAAHLPAIAIPTRRPDGTLPIGFRHVGDLNREDLLLEVAEAFEAMHLVDRPWPALDDR